MTKTSPHAQQPGAVHPTAQVHSTAVVDGGATVGSETRIWHFSHVSAAAKIGARCVLGQNVFVAPGVVIGDGVRVQNNVSIYAGVQVEDDAFLGPSCVFTNVVNPRAHVSRKDEFRPTRIGRGATIGANATVVCGHDVGDYAMIGAGAVVTKNIAPHVLAIGVPARPCGFVCRCGETLPSAEEPQCARCGDRYIVRRDQTVRGDQIVLQGS